MTELVTETIWVEYELHVSGGSSPGLPEFKDCETSLLSFFEYQVIQA